MLHKSQHHHKTFREMSRAEMIACEKQELLKLGLNANKAENHAHEIVDKLLARNLIKDFLLYRYGGQRARSLVKNLLKPIDNNYTNLTANDLQLIYKLVQDAMQQAIDPKELSDKIDSWAQRDLANKLKIQQQQALIQQYRAKLGQTDAELMRLQHQVEHMLDQPNTPSFHPESAVPNKWEEFCNQERARRSPAHLPQSTTASCSTTQTSQSTARKRSNRCRDAEFHLTQKKPRDNAHDTDTPTNSFSNPLTPPPTPR
jgi:hypothetical protein